MYILILCSSPLVLQAVISPTLVTDVDTKGEGVSVKVYDSKTKLFSLKKWVDLSKDEKRQAQKRNRLMELKLQGDAIQEADKEERENLTAAYYRLYKKFFPKS